MYLRNVDDWRIEREQGGVIVRGCSKMATQNDIWIVMMTIEMMMRDLSKVAYLWW